MTSKRVLLNVWSLYDIAKHKVIMMFLEVLKVNVAALVKIHIIVTENLLA